MSIKDDYSDLKKLNLPFDINEVEEQCLKCVRAQLKKYEKTKIDKNVTGGEAFVVPCKGIKKNNLPPNAKNTMSPEMYKHAQAVTDITKFAEYFLKDEKGKPYITRPYQTAILKCTAKRRVLRMSRRSGKTFSVCLEILFYAYTEPNLKIIITGPQITHVQEIITRIRDMIKSNPMLKEAVVHDKSNPYFEIMFGNGSRIRGFPAGTDSKGQGGVGIRGQDCDMCYVEEMDYIGTQAIEGAIFPLLQTNENTTLVGFSTPSGMRTPYYKLCKENPYYKEFHFDYKVLPWWKNIEMEKNNMTHDRFSREFMAEFAETEAGVYKPSYVDRALRKYSYEDNSPQPHCLYTMGVDWNEKYGTEIVILEFNRRTNLFQIADADHIQRAEYTQLAGVQAVLRMNRKWLPERMYVDAGNGSANIELLKKMAHDATGKGDEITARLKRTLKKYDSGAKVETHDPVTKQKIKVPAKPFMVNASVRLFEQEKIRISSNDEKLEAQLRNYIIERQTQSTTVYGCNSEEVADHRLDAMNMAIVAFELEFGELFNSIKNIVSVGMVPDPRKLALENKRTEMPSDPNKITVQDLQTNSPQERRLVEPGQSDLYGLNNGAARTSKSDLGIQTNRYGIETDQEEEYIHKWLQRKRKRANFSKSKPNRTNI